MTEYISVTSDFFSSFNNDIKVRKHWKQLAKKYHPKVGGNTEIMQKINLEYLRWQVINNPFYSKQQWDNDLKE